MTNRKQLFADAAAHYEQCLRLITQMDQAVQQAAGTDYNPVLTLEQFDIILQAILLRVAVADGTFSIFERQFVQSIPNHADLLSYLASATNGRLDLTWDAVASLPTVSQQDLIDILDPLLDDLTDNFIAPLAVLDRATGGIDELSLLTDKIFRIISSLAQMDGRISGSEQKEARAAVTSLLSERWNSYLTTLY